MKKSIIVSILLLGLLLLTACNDTEILKENNVSCDSNLSYPEVEEQYKIITVPMVQNKDLE